jgi:hypothetical protein
VAVRILRFLPSILFGVVVGGLLGWIITGDWIYTIVFGVSLGLAIVATTFVGSSLQRGKGSHGYAAGRVESVQRVGAAADGRQQVDVRVSVFSQDDAPYQTTMRTPVDDAGLRALVPGSLIPLLRLGPKMRPDVTSAPTAPREWLDQVEKLRSEASTLAAPSAVKPWETATTTTPGTKRPGTTTSARGIWRGLLVVAVVAALVLIPAYPSIARGGNNIAQGRWDGSNMATGLYQQDSIDQMIAAAGTSKFTNLGFYPSYILGDAVSRGDADRTDSVQSRYGRAWVEGPSTSQSNDLQAELFDVGALDIAMVAQVARDAVQRAGIRNPESVYAFIRLDSETREPEITVSVNGTYDSGYLDYTFDGELIGAFGSAFE